MTMRGFNMKKSALLLAVILIFVTILLPDQIITAHAQTKDDFEYTINSDGVSVTITDYTGSDENITIPAVLDGFNVTTISDFQFNNIIKNVVIEEGIKKIAETTMVACDNLESITIPSSITSLGIAPFSYCPKLSSIQVSADNAYFCSVDGVLFNKAKTQLYRYPSAKPGNYTIPDSVTTLSPYAFEGCKSFTSIYIPPSLQTLNSNTFEDCDNLLEINVDGTNVYFSSEDGVLFNKSKTRLVKCPPAKSGVYTLPGTVTEIGGNAFWRCGRLTQIVLPTGLTELDQACFYMCSGMTAIDIPNGITEIPMWAFAGCTNLQSVHLPANLTKILDVAFAGCENMTGIAIPDGVTAIGNGAFMDCARLVTISFPDGVTVLAPNVLSGTAISAFDIPEGTGNIGFSAFQDCTNLEAVSIPESIKTIGSFAFSGCSKLDNVNLPSAVESIEGGAFEDCINLKSMVLPSRIKEISKDTFENCSSLLCISIPDGVTEIGDGAFRGCSSLDNINIPANVTEIGRGAFEGCAALKSIVLPSQITEIAQEAFWRCSSLKSLSIPEGVTSIGASAFDGCGKLENIRFAKNLVAIRDYAFFSCYSLRYAVFEGNAPAIGERVFSECQPGFMVYYLNGSTGFTNPWHGYPTQNYDPDTMIGSSIYAIDRTQGYIKGIHISTSVDELKANMINDAAYIRVFTQSSTEYKGDSITTGMSVKLMPGGDVKDQLLAVVPGDTNGDGRITISDYVDVRLHILGLDKLEHVYKEAGDINGDGRINVSDYTLIRLDILGLKPI
jgi:hypothetical protein